MTITAVMSEDQHGLVTSQCRLCGEPVLRIVKASDNQLLLLDPTPVAGGLYEMQTAGTTLKGRRRNIRQVYEEIRYHRPLHGGGYANHDCVPAR